MCRNYLDISCMLPTAYPNSPEFQIGAFPSTISMVMPWISSGPKGGSRGQMPPGTILQGGGTTTFPPSTTTFFSAYWRGQAPIQVVSAPSDTWRSQGLLVVLPSSSNTGEISHTCKAAEAQDSSMYQKLQASLLTAQSQVAAIRSSSGTCPSDTQKNVMLL